MQIRFKKLSVLAQRPTKAHPSDAGADLYAASYVYNGTYDCLVYDTDIAVEIPEGHVGLVFPRSSVYKTGLMMTNSVGVIDSHYRGSIKVCFRKANKLDYPLYKNDIYIPGERIAQLIVVPYPEVEYVETDELSETDRGEGGFGSTGK